MVKSTNYINSVFHTKASNKLLSVGVKYSLRGLIRDVNYGAWAAYLQYGPNLVSIMLALHLALASYNIDFWTIV